MMIFVAGGTAVPAPKSYYVARGYISNENDEENRSAPGSCPPVTDRYCATLWDDENCEGRKFDVYTHGSSEPNFCYTTPPNQPNWASAKPCTLGSNLPEKARNDAEVVVVRAGCEFTGMWVAMINKSVRPKANELLVESGSEPSNCHAVSASIQHHLQVTARWMQEAGLASAARSTLGSMCTVTSSTATSATTTSPWNVYVPIRRRHRPIPKLFIVCKTKEY